MTSERALVWFRRDLRDVDHAALSAALAGGRAAWCAFVFDPDLLATLPGPRHRRLEFLHGCLVELEASLRARGGGLIVRLGRPRAVLPELARELGVSAVYASRDYEPWAKRRDREVGEALREVGVAFHLVRDQVIFEGDDVLTQAGKPYTVFTPYRRAWTKRLMAEDFAALPCQGTLLGGELSGVPPLAEIGFEATDLAALGVRPGMSGARELWEDFAARGLAHYAEQRDFPALRGTSGLSPHLRFGTISIRELVRTAVAGRAEAWLAELIWREFYFTLLDRFPHVVGGSFKPEFDGLRWAEAPESFAAWCAGRTGYPLVDAAMRQLNQTGWMHNRLRMVVASFLTKDLGVDWRLGERYFADQLLDFDMAANNGGWQWAASTGCDAQPWFRIFNPVTQSEKFDPQGQFIRRFVPELARVPLKFLHAPWKMERALQEHLGVVVGRDYPAPVVDHAQAREETLARYGAVRK